jgi:hypothetical protein
MGTDSDPEVKRPERGFNHLVPFSVETEERVELHLSGFGGLVVSMLASCTQDRGFAPSRSHRIFSGEKLLSMPSFADFRHVKETYNLPWKPKL